MNGRERLLSILLGSFIALGVVGLLAYLLVISPYQDKNARIAELEKDVGTKTAQKDANEKGNRRYSILKQISLPPEPNTAQREYDYILTELLTRASVPARSRTVNVKLPPDKTTIPLINPGAPAKEKRYAYQRVTADITLTKVNLESLMKFLTAYHQLGVLHHITKLTVKTSDTEVGGSLGRRGGEVDRERKDLSVTLTTEAVILDGVSPRESLVRIPTPVAVLGGAAAYYVLDTNPDVGRWLALHFSKGSLPTEQYRRDYLATVYKDPLHGKMPDPITPFIRVETPPPGVDQFIRMSGWTTNSDGSANVDITDMANNVTYKLLLTRKGEKLNTSVSKERMEDGRWVKYEIIPETNIRSWENKPFVISDTEMAIPSSTRKTLTVHGLVPFGVILSAPAEDEKVVAPAFGARGGPGFGGGRGGGRGGQPATRSVSATAKKNAEAAVAGAAITYKAERYYVWSVGQTLREMLQNEVPREKLDGLLKNALAPLMPESAVTAPVATAQGDGR